MRTRTALVTKVFIFIPSHVSKLLLIILYWCTNLFSSLLDEAPRYERDRSASPRPTRRNDSPRGGPRRSASPDRNGRADERLVHLITNHKIAYSDK